MAQLSAKNSQTAYDFTERLTQAAAAQIRRYRQARSMSTRDLADRCAELGMPIKRSVLANLETRRRSVLTLAELFVLAAALEVPPIELALPLGREEDAEILPGLFLPTWDAGLWFRGDGALIGTDQGLVFHSSADEWTDDNGEPVRDLPIDWLMAHEHMVRRCVASINSLAHLNLLAHPAVPQSADLAGATRQLEESLATEERELARHRAIMRRKGVAVPALPQVLHYVDELPTGPGRGR